MRNNIDQLNQLLSKCFVLMMRERVCAACQSANHHALLDGCRIGGQASEFGALMPNRLSA
jgi:hypothetical protein